MTGLIDFEIGILNWIQHFMRSEAMDNLQKFITHLGDAGIIWIILTACLIIYPKTRRVGIICAISLLCSLVITNLVLKNLFERMRPFNYEHIQLLIKAPTDYSFPSGHTSASFEFAFVLIKEKLKIGKINLYIPATILAVVISFSRLYLYVHFPTDILGGMVVGLICSIIAFKVIKKFGKTSAI